MGRTNPNFSGQSGMTMVEIMIVLAIIGILAAIATPKFQQMRAESFKKTHGYYPAGYVDPFSDVASNDKKQEEDQRDHTDRLMISKSNGEYVPGGGYIYYYYDSRTELCFASLGKDGIINVPCDKVRMLVLNSN